MGVVCTHVRTYVLYGCCMYVRTRALGCPRVPPRRRGWTHIEQLVRLDPGRGPGTRFDDLSICRFVVPLTPPPRHPLPTENYHLSLSCRWKIPPRISSAPRHLETPIPGPQSPEEAPRYGSESPHLNQRQPPLFLPGPPPTQRRVREGRARTHRRVRERTQRRVRGCSART